MQNGKWKPFIPMYLEYTEDTESAKQFHYWCALSAISSALQSKVYFKNGRFKIPSNIFVILVAEPGVARKTQAIRLAKELLVEVPTITHSADSTSREALLMDLEGARQEISPIGEPLYVHCSMTVTSDEFESFLGDKNINARMVMFLTDIYDGKLGSFRHRVKHSESQNIVNPWVTLLAATTPNSLASSFPMSAVGGGLSSRIVFVWSSSREKAVPIPEETERILRLKTKLIEALTEITLMRGAATYSTSAKQWWIDWYNSYDMLDSKRLCSNYKFIAWYSRKPTLLQKVALLHNVSNYGDLTVKVESFVEALKIIESVEYEMENAFMGVGKSEMSQSTKMVEDLIYQHCTSSPDGMVSEDRLFTLIWNDIDTAQFDSIYQLLSRKGTVKRVIGKKSKKIKYKWVGK